MKLLARFINIKCYTNQKLLGYINDVLMLKNDFKDRNSLYLYDNPTNQITHV